jgi:hypothetical protein
MLTSSSYGVQQNTSILMITIYSEYIPLINQLDHSDKLRLAQWLIKVTAQKEGINDLEVDELLKDNQQHIHIV